MVMVRKVVAMDVRLRIGVASEGRMWRRSAGESRGSVWRNVLSSASAVTNSGSGGHGASVPWRQRPARGGSTLQPEAKVDKIRRELEGLGVDAGASSIQWHLWERQWPTVPCEVTIWRVLEGVVDTSAPGASHVVVSPLRRVGSQRAVAVRVKGLRSATRCDLGDLLRGG